jgi:transketolase C-terminal domain/subunit
LTASARLGCRRNEPDPHPPRMPLFPTISFGVDVPKGDYTVPLGPAAVRRPGSDVTLLANMLMVHRAHSAAERLATSGIDVEVIDMRSLTPLDMENGRRLSGEDRTIACGGGG